MTNNKQKGRFGEVLAVKFLEDKNYIVIFQNFRFKRVGEIDIIALNNGELHFVEVKARSSNCYGVAVDAVDKRKQQKIRTVASAYISRCIFDYTAIHFDVMEVDLISKKINLIEDAF